MRVPSYTLETNNFNKMKKLLFFLFACFTVMCTTSPQQAEKEKIFYIYDNKQILRKSEIDQPSWKGLIYETDVYMPKYYDSILISNNRKIYSLFHYEHHTDYYDTASCNAYSDTSFVAQKKVLDTLDYWDSDWLSKESNLDSLWQPIRCWRCAGIYDTAQIYLIYPIENTDSLIFRQVHRFFHQTQ